MTLLSKDFALQRSHKRWRLIATYLSTSLLLCFTLISCNNSATVSTSNAENQDQESPNNNTPNNAAAASNSNTTDATNNSSAPQTGAALSSNLNLQTTTQHIEAARFLSQSTYGATSEDIIELAQNANYEAWIDHQLTLPVSLQLPWVKANNNGGNAAYRHYIWWRNVVDGEDQLRQRMALALSEIFVISDIDYTLANDQYAVAHYFDMLSENAFSNYRDLLEKITLNPTMGIYLSMLRNEKADPERHIRPDENYAREVLQLFSIGLYELDEGANPIPQEEPKAAYSQQTVEAFARVFTGWNFANTDVWQSSDLTSFDKISPMIPVESYHDTGEKILLNGVTLPAGQDTRTDLRMALDNIFEHTNTGPFISRALIQRLVTSNPSSEYVARVAAVFNRNSKGVRGDLGSVLKAILLDDEARNGYKKNPQFGKFKEPLLRLTQLYRALNAIPGKQASGNYHSYARLADQIADVYGQAILRSPSVFNFFLPEHVISGRATNAKSALLVAPEQQILTEANVAGINNDLHTLIYTFNTLKQTDSTTAQLDVSQLVTLAKQSTQNLLDSLNVLLLSGSMDNTMRELMMQHMNHLRDNATDQDAHAIAVTQTLDAVYMIAASPYFLVQR